MIPICLGFYTDPGSGSMILQLLLGGAAGLWLALRLCKQRILNRLGIRKEKRVDQLPAHPAPESESEFTLSARS
jgi:hypothetical protein